jgi:tetratricopeptide (TPR) repeat protein
MNSVRFKIILLAIICFCFHILGGQQRTIRMDPSGESDDFSYALKLFNDKFYDLSAQQFIRFMNNYSDSDMLDEAGYYAGMSLLQLGDYENARIEFQGVAVNFPGSKKAGDSWFMVGECYSKLNKAEEAAKAYETVKILYPKHAKAAESALFAGKIYQKLHYYEKAEQLYILIQDRYLESSYYFPAVLAHGNLYLKKSENSKAEKKFKKVIEGTGDEELKAEAFLYLGDLYHEQGYLNDAKMYYEVIMNKYQDSQSYDNALIALAQIHLQQSNYPEAQKLLIKGLKNKPGKDISEYISERLGDCHYLCNQFALAAQNYSQCISNEKDSLFVVRKVKNCLALQKQNLMNKVIEELEPIVLNEKYFDYKGYDLAKKLYFDCIITSNKFDQGIAVLNAIKTETNFTFNDYAMLIEYYKYTANWLAIIREIEPIIQSNQSFHLKDDFIFEIANAYENLKEYQKSDGYYRKILVEFTSSDLIDQAESRLDYINKYSVIDQNIATGQLALLIGDILNQEKQGFLNYQLGKIYFEYLKDYKNALVQYKKSLLISENDSIKADIFYQIGLCYLRLADDKSSSKENSAKYLQSAKENFSLAMENINTASQPDRISLSFVELGIRLDNPPLLKQIGYYETLIKKYPDSPLQEQCFANLAQLYSKKDSTFSKAVEIYNKLISKYPSSVYLVDYLYQRSKLSISSKLQGSFSPSEDFKKIVSVYPNSKPAANALYFLASDYESQGKYSEAKQLFNKLLVDYYYTNIAQLAAERIGDNFLRTGEYDLALDKYIQELNIKFIEDIVLVKEFLPDKKLDLLFKIGNGYYLKSDFNQAHRYLTTYIAQDPGGINYNQACLILGDLYLSLNDPEAAIVALRKVSVKDIQKYKLALHKIADIYFTNLQDYSQASTNYNELAKLVKGENQEGEVHAKNIIAVIRNGKISQANKLISLYSDRFKKEKNYLAAFQFELGSYYRKIDDFNKATDFFKKVRKKYSKSDYVDDAEYNLALVYISLNKMKESLDILTGFSSKYPESDKQGLVFNTLGGIYFRSQKYESAIESFKNALEKQMEPEHKRQVISNLIKAYTFVNFWDAALALSREYIDNYSNAEDIIDKKIIMGQAYVALNQYERAVEILKQSKLEADSEKEPEIQFYIGDAYLKAGQYENAIAEFVKIPLLSRKTKLQWEASALYFAGQAYEKLGKIDDAVRMYQEIINRPGIDIILKKDAQKRISQIKG